MYGDDEPKSMHILALSGSLRAGSSNARLLRAAARLAPQGARFTFYDQQIASMPHFSPDLDGEDAVTPPEVAEFRHLLGAADGVLICCPEYAHGVPGAFKDALDWIVSSGELTDKPIALVMASTSGAEYARAALVPTLRVMGAKIIFERSLSSRRGISMKPATSPIPRPCRSREKRSHPLSPTRGPRLVPFSAAGDP
jgi:chromate reductase, NAD(P)H dehydrogenase (quinone)